ncbi:MAG: hypothetical protein Q9170_006754 [Blastenia crenularia]
MFDRKSKYQPLQGDESQYDFSSQPQSASRASYTLWGFLVVSILVNFGLTYDKLRYPSLEGTPQVFAKSKYEFSTDNTTRSQEMWDNINFDAGMIYITPEQAADMELPPAQDFPWDPELKQSIQRSFMELSAGLSTTYPMPHVMHCLDVLRDDVICHADDTPRYTTTTQKPESGMGQIRQCRDWSKLEKWASNFSGCWRYLDAKHDESSEIWRWTYCPKGTPWHDRARKWTKKHQRERPDATPGL